MIFTRIPSGVLVFLGLTVLVITLWSFFNLSEIGTNEEWLIYASLDQNPDIIRFNLGLESVDSVFITRPLTWLPWWLGHKLYPDSFTGTTLVLMGILILKGFVAWLLLKKLSFQNEALAFAAAALFIVYPSDGGNLTARTANIHLGLLFCITALWLYTLAWQKQSRWLLALALGAQIISLCIYEVGILMILAGPLLLLWLGERFSRKWLIYSAVWSIFPIVFTGVIIAISLNEDSYIGTRLATADVEGTLGIPHIVANLISANFFRAWQDAATFTQWSQPHNIRAFLVTILILVPIIYLLRSRSVTEDWRVNMGLVVGGVGFMGLGYAPYVLTENLNSAWRIYLYAAFGAALAAVALMNLFSASFKRGGHFIFVGLACLLLTGAIIYSFYMRGYYERLSALIDDFLVDVVEVIPDVNTPATIILIDETQPSHTAEVWVACTLMSDCFGSSLRYLYNNSDVDGVICSDVQRTSFVEVCEFTPDGLRLTATRGEEQIIRSYSHESMIVLTLKADGVSLRDTLPVAGSTYAPFSLIEPLPDFRIVNALAGWSQAIPVMEQYVIEFDEGTIDGSGWWQPEDSTAWTADSPFLLNTRLSPDHEYQITFSITGAITPEHLNDLTLFVNDVPVALTVDNQVFKGIISSSAIERNSRRTRLKFMTPEPVAPVSLGMGQDIRKLGVRFDWVKIEPVS